MKYNIDGAKSITTSYPDLLEVDGFKTASDKHIRYILLLYQFEDNEFIKTYRDDIIKRRRKASEKVNFTPPNIDEIIAGKDDYTNKLIINFTSFLNHKVWMLITSIEQRFVEAIELTMKPLATLDEKSRDLLSSAQLKSKLSEDCDDMVKKLDSYYRILFNDDKEIIKTINRKVTSENVMEILNKK